MKQLPVLEPGDKPRKATWYTLTLPGDSPCARVGHSCSYLPPVGNAKRGKVFIVGGANPNRSFSDVHAMDLGKHQWDLVTCKGLLPRYEHASFIPSCTSDHIWVFGGANQSGNRNCLQPDPILVLTAFKYWGFWTMIPKYHLHSSLMFLRCGPRQK
uniref:Rab9 effector protein with kelch motifs n=1 Tax=Colobus angolensis palliatus TaxID=336983 RepID=A0A2K5K676_COLAP